MNDESVSYLKKIENKMQLHLQHWSNGKCNFFYVSTPERRSEKGTEITSPLAQNIFICVERWVISKKR